MQNYTKIDNYLASTGVRYKIGKKEIAVGNILTFYIVLKIDEDNKKVLISFYYLQGLLGKLFNPGVLPKAQGILEYLMDYFLKEEFEVLEVKRN